MFIGAFLKRVKYGHSCWYFKLRASSQRTVTGLFSISWEEPMGYKRRRPLHTCIGLSCAACASCEEANPKWQVLRWSLQVERESQSSQDQLLQKWLLSLVSLFHPNFIYLFLSFRAEVVSSIIAWFLYITFIYAWVERWAGRGRIV